MSKEDPTFIVLSLMLAVWATFTGFAEMLGRKTTKPWIIWLAFIGWALFGLSLVAR